MNCYTTTNQILTCEHHQSTNHTGFQLWIRIFIWPITLQSTANCWVVLCLIICGNMKGYSLYHRVHSARGPTQHFSVWLRNLRAQNWMEWRLLTSSVANCITYRVLWSNLGSNFFCFIPRTFYINVLSILTNRCTVLIVTDVKGVSATCSAASVPSSGSTMWVLKTGCQHSYNKINQMH